MKKPDYRKRDKAYRAIERDTFSADEKVEARAGEAMTKLSMRTITKEEFDFYVAREEEYRFIND
jgi:hypothetical protein